MYATENAVTGYNMHESVASDQCKVAPVTYVASNRVVWIELGTQSFLHIALKLLVMRVSMKVEQPSLSHSGIPDNCHSTLAISILSHPFNRPPC